jgi:hypothetical protein
MGTSGYDAILVPGGGVREGGALPPWVCRRLDLAAELHGGSRIVTLSAGTPHRPPPLDAAGFPIFESIAAARYLIAAGVPPDRLLTETHSYDTIGNAYFSRVIHAEPLRFRRLLVITSDFHLPRTRAAFEWIYRLTPCPLYELSFQGAGDGDMDAGALRHRVSKEQSSLETLAPLAARLTTLNAFHRWLFTEHAAYRPDAAAFARRVLPSAALPSY